MIVGFKGRSSKSIKTECRCLTALAWVWNLCLDYLGFYGFMDWQRLCSSTSHWYVFWTCWSLWDLHATKLLSSLYLSVPLNYGMTFAHPYVLQQQWHHQKNQQLQISALPMRDYPGWLSHLCRNSATHTAVTTLQLCIPPHQGPSGQSMGTTTDNTRVTQHQLWCRGIPAYASTSQWYGSLTQSTDSSWAPPPMSSPICADPVDTTHPLGCCYKWNLFWIPC